METKKKRQLHVEVYPRLPCMSSLDPSPPITSRLDPHVRDERSTGAESTRCCVFGSRRRAGRKKSFSRKPRSAHRVQAPRSVRRASPRKTKTPQQCQNHQEVDCLETKTSNNYFSHWPIPNTEPLPPHALVPILDSNDKRQSRVEPTTHFHQTPQR